MIRVYVCHHKPWPVLENSILTPIQVGRDISGTDLGLLADNTGDNISSKNAVFCELTAIYWAWKNDTASEWLGFMHYRRFLNFGQKPWPADEEGCVRLHDLDEASVRSLGLDAPSIEARLNADPEVQAFLPGRLSVKGGAHSSAFEQYVGSAYHNAGDLETAREVVAQLCPEDLKYFDQTLAAQDVYLMNLFVMRRALFLRYCEWLFPIVFEVERRLDLTNYCVQARRVIGYLSERLLDAFIRKQRQEQGLKAVELQRIFVDLPGPLAVSPRAALRPHPDALPVVLASDNAFVPHLAALMLSLIDAVRAGGGLDLIILDGGISGYNRHLLEHLFRANTTAASRLSFIDCEPLYRDIPTHMHFTTPTFYRLSLCRLLPRYSRVVYLDCDTIVLGDLWELWRVDLGGAAAAAVPDLIMKCMVKHDVVSTENSGGLPAGEYLRRKVFAGGSVDGYFQAGVMLFDLERLKELDLEARAERDLASEVYWFVDQDVLNKHLAGRVKYLDTAWNCVSVADTLLSQIGDANWVEKIKEDIAAPKLIHYAGHEAKPWNNRAASMAGPYWHYALRTFWCNTGADRVATLPLASPEQRPGLVSRGIRFAWRCLPKSLRDACVPLKRKYLSITKNM